MSVISIRLSEKLLVEVDRGAQALHLPRTAYIREAIEHMNQEIASRARKQQLRNASMKVRKESMRVNAELSRIEHDPEKTKSR